MSVAIDQFCGDALLCLTGDLSQLDLTGFPEPRPTTKGNKVELPLELATRDIISSSVLPRVGLCSRIWHVEIRKAGRLVFAAYDQFGEQCVSVDAPDADIFVDRLREMGLVREDVCVSIDDTE